MNKLNHPRILSIILVVMLFGTIQTARSQVLIALLFGDKLSSDTVQMGINIDGGRTSLSGLDDVDLRSNWAFGLVFEIKLKEQLSLQPELTIKTPGGAADVVPFLAPPSDWDDLTTSTTVERVLSYMTIPVFLKYHFGPVGVGVGPQIGYMLKGTDEYVGTVFDDDDLTLSRDIKDDVNRFDAGVAAMVEYSFAPEKKMRSLRAHVKYYNGLLDVVKDNPGDGVYNRVLLFGLSVPVGGDSEE